jgi:hypothetical protein
VRLLLASATALILVSQASATPETVYDRALSAAGAPLTTPITCQPAPLNENGWAIWALPQRIILAPSVCFGLRYLEESSADRLYTQSHHASPLYWAGVGALVLLHESAHIAGDHDETGAECTAMGLLPTLLRAYLHGKDYQDAMWYAQNYDQHLPSLYHQREC